MEMQNLENKPWENEELNKMEDDLLKLQESDLAQTVKTYKAKTGIGEVPNFKS